MVDIVIAPWLMASTNDLNVETSSMKLSPFKSGEFHINCSKYLLLKLDKKYKSQPMSLMWQWVKTHIGRVTHICVSDLTSIGSDNGLSPGRRQAIIRTKAGILLIRPLGTNFSEFLVEILIVSFKKMPLKVSSAKRRPFCLGLNGLI